MPILKTESIIIKPTVERMHYFLVISFFAYFFMLLCMGLYFHKKQTSAADFIIGNRSLNFWLTALSAHASDMSAWLFMAFPAAVFSSGLPKIWIAWGLIGGMFVNWQFIATRLRKATEKYNAHTLSTFFERRFNDTSGTIRFLTAAIALFFLASYIAAGLIAMGLLFESVFGINYYVGLSVAMLVVVIYTLIGGFVTVAWTDLFQSLFLMAMIIFVPAYAFMHLPNGWQSITEAAKSQNASLFFFKDLSSSSILEAIFMATWGLGYFGQPHIVTKFMGIKNVEEMHKSKYVGMSWLILTLLGATAVGLIGLPFFDGQLRDPQLVFIDMVPFLFHPLITGFILCAILAANMSTMDSQLLVCASIISEDFYKGIFKKEASPQKLLLISRLGLVFTALSSLILAYNKSTTVLEAVRYAWAGLGCSFGPLMLMSLYSQSVNKYGAIAGILTGGMIAGTWEAYSKQLLGHNVPAEIPAFAVSLISIYLVSKWTGKITIECNSKES
ncbi:putative symporter YcgO [Neochlamydia sp. EPS4]|nr:putative symporter YcgO [Neochlamydia sp. EPS4]